MTDLTRLLAEVQRPEASHVDQIKRRACGTLQWFLERDCQTHPIHNNNQLEFFICGEDGFTAIAADIQTATRSIDLVLWGFDPGMELTRSGSLWPRGPTFGDLLVAKARAGVEVRLLVWYDGDVPLLNILAHQSQNVPDIGPMSGIPMHTILPVYLSAPITAGMTRTEVLRRRSEYCRAWWNAALHGGFSQLEVRLRSASAYSVKHNMFKYLPTSVTTIPESVGMRMAATHHQKPILIDYAAPKDQAGKPKACGYVMGLNSVTDFWDTSEHIFNQPKREESAEGAPYAKPWHIKPYRDYAIRLQGEALYCLNQNFVEAWDKANGYLLAHRATIFSGSLAKQRESVRPQDIAVPRGARCRAQILRTYPDAQDATILKAYVLATANAVSYVYIENQYFQLTDWSKMLKAVRAKYCDALIERGAKPSDIAPLHVFVVTPQPERNEMVPNTYDTLNQLAQGQGMSRYDGLVQGQRKARDQHRPLPPDSGGGIVSDSLRDAPPDPRAELDALGIKTLVAMLMTYDNCDEARDISIRKRDSNARTALSDQQQAANKKNHVRQGLDDDVEPGNFSEYNIRPDRYREIYIHSKLMFVDDVYTTLGSANLNARSMTGDSEFNICTEASEFTQSSRQRVWGNLAGRDLDGGGGTRSETADTFSLWLDRMTTNRSHRRIGLAPESDSFIHPFEDPRGAPLVRLV